MSITCSSAPLSPVTSGGNSDQRDSGRQRGEDGEGAKKQELNEGEKIIEEHEAMGDDG